jgi:glycosyltransferase involved in cell wall biosynthesis
MVSRANMEVARGLGIAYRDQMVLIRSGISIGEYQHVPESRGEIRKTLGITPHQKVVLNVSCLKPQKAPEDFVEVAARVAPQESDAVFLLVGDGILRPKVESAALRHGLGDRFRLLGWRRDVPQLLKAADVLVLTSRWEGLPRVLPQAMAAGIPAVATAVDGSPEAIEDGINGFLVQPGDVEGMAERILRLLGDPLLRDRMGREGQKRVGEFDIDLMVRQQEELYEELVKEWARSKGGG